MPTQNISSHLSHRLHSKAEQAKSCSKRLRTGSILLHIAYVHIFSQIVFLLLLPRDIGAGVISKPESVNAPHEHKLSEKEHFGYFSCFFFIILLLIIVNSIVIIIIIIIIIIELKSGYHVF